MPEKIFATPLIYLDQAATSRPKASGVGEAMRSYIEDVCVNISRSAYAPSTEAAVNALETRELLCALFGFGDPTHVIFTPGHTVSLNMVLKGILRPGDHALVSALEHNAVMRPLTQLAEAGVAFDRIPMRGDDELDLDAAERLMRPNTKLCLVSHASNVSGTVLPIGALAALCERKGVYFAVDAAQTAGHLPIDLSGMTIDAFCVPSHKGLRGPGGVAAMLLSARFAAALEPLITGGTGSDSNSEIQPRYMPDRFESGTLNLAGVYGLHAALSELLTQGVTNCRTKELHLLERFTSGLNRLKGFRTIGAGDLSRRVGVVSCDFARLDNAVVADRLSSNYGVLTRCGLHCAPNAHKTYGTFPQGTVRFSMNHTNTEQEIDAALAALAEILND